MRGKKTKGIEAVRVCKSYFQGLNGWFYANSILYPRFNTPPPALQLLSAGTRTNSDADNLVAFSSELTDRQ